MSLVDTTIRNLDEEAYRALKARAALTGRTVGDAINEAIRAWLARPDPGRKTASFFELAPEDLGEGTEHLSESIDSIVYGT